MAHAQGSDQVDDAAGDVRLLSFQGQPLVGEDRGQGVEVQPSRRLLWRHAVDRLHSQQGEKALGLLGRPHLSGYPVTRSQVEAPDLGWRHVDIVLAGNVSEGAQEAVAVGQNLQDSLGKKEAVLLGLRLHDLEDQLFFAKPGIVGDLHLTGGLEQIRHGLLF